MKKLLCFITYWLLASSAYAQDFEWAKQIGGTEQDDSSALALDGAGNVYTTGYFQGTVDFDPGLNTFNLTSMGNFDIFVSKLDADGNFVWAKQMGGTDFGQGYALALDGEGNVYTTGYFQGTVDFDPGPGTFNLISAGNLDIFVSKLDANGNFVWAKRMGGTGFDVGFDLALDGEGNVFTTGSFRDTVDFDPGPDTFNLTSAGDISIFISKLDAGGNFVWAKQMGGTDYNVGLAFALDGAGNVYTTGSFEGTADFDPGPETFTLTSAGSRDIFIAKLDAGGNLVWAKQMGGTSFDQVYALALDGAGNVFTTGRFAGTADFDPGPGAFNLTSAVSADIFVSKLDANGNFVWAKQMGGTAFDVGLGLALDGEDNVYTTGYFRGTADFDPGPETFILASARSDDVSVSKLDAEGNFVWARSLGGTDGDVGYALALDGGSNVYITGSFKEIVDFDPGPGTFNLTSAGEGDIFILKLRQPPVSLADSGPAAAAVVVYPNPAAERLRVSGWAAPTTSRTITLCDALGRQVRQVSATGSSAELDVSTLPTAVYSLRVQDGAHAQTEKLVIRR